MCGIKEYDDAVHFSNCGVKQTTIELIRQNRFEKHEGIS